MKGRSRTNSLKMIISNVKWFISCAIVLMVIALVYVVWERSTDLGPITQSSEFALETARRLTASANEMREKGAVMTKRYHELTMKNLVATQELSNDLHKQQLAFKEMDKFYLTIMLSVFVVVGCLVALLQWKSDAKDIELLEHIRSNFSARLEVLHEQDRPQKLDHANEGKMIEGSD